MVCLTCFLFSSASSSDLLELKSRTLLPKKEEETDDEDPRDILIKRLLNYQNYKESVEKLREYETIRKEVYTREPTLEEYKNKVDNTNLNISLDDLISALSRFLENKEAAKPLTTKITNKEYSVGKRSIEIRDILRKKKKVNFFELFEEVSKEYIVVTFLAILNMSKRNELYIKQENNFENILIEEVNKWKQ